MLTSSVVNGRTKLRGISHGSDRSDPSHKAYFESIALHSSRLIVERNRLVPKRPELIRTRYEQSGVYRFKDDGFLDAS